MRAAWHRKESKTQEIPFGAIAAALVRLCCDALMWMRASVHTQEQTRGTDASDRCTNWPLAPASDRWKPALIGGKTRDVIHLWICSDPLTVNGFALLSGLCCPGCFRDSPCRPGHTWCVVARCLCSRSRPQSSPTSNRLQKAFI